MTTINELGSAHEAGEKYFSGDRTGSAGDGDSSANSHDANSARAPAAVRYALFSVLGAVIAGALYLVAVRGDALLADLSAIAALICG
ncbi:MAG: hypothetical protein K0U74_01370 [Alphaproteobacteria bacterium]|nr:hypothetical protein [Alphaproteobacteria bacterium]